MPDKRIHFVAGLPRSGSTLLINILAQNPRFHVTGTSGILPILVGARDQWEEMPEFKAWQELAEIKDNVRLNVLRGILNGYFAHVEQPVVFDKSRGWPAYIEMLERMNIPLKILAPVRDMRDVLASFEKLYRRNKGVRPIPGERNFYAEFQHLEGRCRVWSGGGQPIGIAWNRLRDAVDRGKGKYLHFIEYEKLTVAPKRTLAEIYEFLDEEPYAHDFDNVAQVTQEDDVWHGYDDLHTIRAKVEPAEPQWPAILGEAVARPYGVDHVNFWRKVQLVQHDRFIPPAQAVERFQPYERGGLQQPRS
jgi:sulfotransferase